MANLRALVKRRKAVRNIRKITRTMELIATARFKKALDRATEADAYTRKIAELAADLSKNAGEVSHPLLVTRPVKKSLLLVITANRGLCGGYNGSIIREAMHGIRAYKEASVPFDLEVAGRRGIGFFRFQGIVRSKEYTQFEDKPAYNEVDVLASRYIDLFVSGQIDEVKVAYMKFITAARQAVTLETLLPLSSMAVETRRPGGEGGAAGSPSRVRVPAERQRNPGRTRARGVQGASLQVLPRCGRERADRPARGDEVGDRERWRPHQGNHAALQSHAAGEHHEGDQRAHRRLRGAEIMD